MSLMGQTAWITGASSGIGEALAYAFSAQGARLVLSARRQAQLETVRASCTNPEQHLIAPLDLAQSATLPAIVETVLEQTGYIDILINNGGVSQRSLAIETPLDVDRRIMEVNYFGTIALTKALLPSMLARQSGQIVVISSVVGKFGSPVRSTYSASKHALHGFFDSLRAEVHEHGIGVTIVCPGFVTTDISVNALTKDGSAQGTMDNAQAKGMAPDECAARILRAVAANKDEVYIGGREIMGVHINRLAPGLFNRIIRRTSVT